jgi:hypothetical protein
VFKKVQHKFPDLIEQQVSNLLQQLVERNRSVCDRVLPEILTSQAAETAPILLAYLITKTSTISRSSYLSKGY